MAPRQSSIPGETKEQILRRKLVNTEMNPIVDALLSIIILVLTPFIYLFSLIHDKLMFRFLNKTYIYNVSWEVRALLFSRVVVGRPVAVCDHRSPQSPFSSPPPLPFSPPSHRTLAWTTACST